ncbi:MAG: hypothetical protein IT160_02850 [Bryobacterales bacterium]|nr:hypothetical protein [Bryobacterales bacterium]
MAASSRIASMDQFRGYTMAGMFLVNFIGAFAVVHPVFKHHNNYNSYADTIMPHFFFAVGFSLRLALLRHIERMGRSAAYRKAVTRCLSLILIGLVVYHLDGNFRNWQDLQKLGWGGFIAQSFWRSPFQALVHIAITSLWILPVIGASARVRVIFLAGTSLLHLALSHAFWYSLLWDKKVIDGGQLGFISWAIPTLMGSFAYDWIAKRGSAGAMKPLLQWGLVLSVFGYALSCLNAVFNPVQAGGLSRFLVEPPFWPPSRPVDLWTMSQRAGSNSYLWFSAGFSLLVYALFVWLSDQKGKQLSMLRVFGLNPLAGYIIHGVVADAVRPYAPGDSPLYWVAVTFAIYFGITWLFVWGLDKQKIYLRM